MKNTLLYPYYKNIASFKRYDLDCIVVTYHGLVEKFGEGILERNFHLYKSFEEHIRFFHKKLNIISLQEFYYRIANNLSLKNSVLITFDDGYANNLVAREIFDSISPDLSFTIFITTGKIGIHDESIWTANLSLLMLKSEKSDLLFEGKILDLNDREKKKLHFNTVRAKLKKLNAADRKEAYNKIAEQFGGDELRSLMQQYPQFELLSWDACRQLAANNTEIESHGVNHELLHDNQDSEVMNTEITSSKKIIKEKLGRDVISYAYPNGDYSDAAIEILKRNEYKLAFTTREGLFGPDSQPMLIQRITLPNNMNSFYKKITQLNN